MCEQQSPVRVPSIHSPFSVANRVMKQKRRILLDSFGEENKKRFSLLSPGIHRTLHTSF
jgi:hypothetical protein